MISILNTPEGITLSIRDNGVGIPHDLPMKTGLGLRSMNYRADEIGATLMICPADERGTVVTCVLRREP